jgi:hypothetical protein
MNRRKIFLVSFFGKKCDDKKKCMKQMRQPAHDIRDPTRLLATSEPTEECVCAPGRDVGVLKTTLTSQLHHIEVWASCDDGALSSERPYDPKCNRVLLKPGEVLKFPETPVSMYDPMGSHLHVRVAMANAASPHYNQDGVPWLKSPLNHCKCSD